MNLILDPAFDEVLVDERVVFCAVGGDFCGSVARRPEASSFAWLLRQKARRFKRVAQSLYLRLTFTSGVEKEKIIIFAIL